MVMLSAATITDDFNFMFSLTCAYVRLTPFSYFLVGRYCSTSLATSELVVSVHFMGVNFS